MAQLVKDYKLTASIFNKNNKDSLITDLIFNAKVDDDFVLGRESWWKEVLKSEDFGYNGN
ncbi:hypothetical protein CJ213_01950 [Gardnerella swidsinskii]|uniref:Uncharacterized protein n=1 Tax=Gardnerella swidsinskii TaxID=2792979 RepID=A0A9X7I958_9BIFI|nr:hypothetical protein [Gardnerella swidsinskii]PMC54919.1 hypothetical protein CJ213_01950 [Gardnerella swidsinskii]